MVDGKIADHLRKLYPSVDFGKPIEGVELNPDSELELRMDTTIWFPTMNERQTIGNTSTGLVDV